MRASGQGERYVRVIKLGHVYESAKVKRCRLYISDTAVNAGNDGIVDCIIASQVANTIIDKSWLR